MSTTVLYVTRCKKCGVLATTVEGQAGRWCHLCEAEERTTDGLMEKISVYFPFEKPIPFAPHVWPPRSADINHYRAPFLWPHDDGSIEALGYEFANANTEECQRQCWDELVKKIEARVYEKLGLDTAARR